MENEIIKRILNKSKQEGDCLVWQGGLSKGYGRVSFKGKYVNTHTIMYQGLIGKIPKGLVLDHLCRNRACCNVKHLEIVSHRENILRGVGPAAKHAQMTHCINGHEFTPENTLIVKTSATKWRTWRRCKECKRIRAKKYSRDPANYVPAINPRRCQSCGTVVKMNPWQKYCGSLKDKTGCSHLVRTLRKRKLELERYHRNRKLALDKA